MVIHDSLSEMPGGSSTSHPEDRNHTYTPDTIRHATYVVVLVASSLLWTLDGQAQTTSPQTWRSDLPTMWITSSPTYPWEDQKIDIEAYLATVKDIQLNTPFRLPNGDLCTISPTTLTITRRGASWSPHASVTHTRDINLLDPQTTLRINALQRDATWRALDVTGTKTVGRGWLSHDFSRNEKDVLPWEEVWRIIAAVQAGHDYIRPERDPVTNRKYDNRITLIQRK